jgi:GntP family gluconate:H+ symporter
VLRIIIAFLVSVTGLVLWPRFTRLNAFFALIAAAIVYGVIAGISFGEIIMVMQVGFGSLLQQIGIIVALGSVLGILLEKTGAMEAISIGLLQGFGKRRSVTAVAVIGALVGIPVFCDSGFIILSGLIPSIAMKSGSGAGSLVLALSAGLYTTHVLVPPTPGPLAAAATLGLGGQVGTVMLVGLLGSIPVVLVSVLYASRAGRKIQISGTESKSHFDPSMKWHLAVIPLILPILLMAVASLAKIVSEESAVTRLLSIVGLPVVALLLGVVIAFMLVDRRKHTMLPEWVTTALKDAGVIILITGAGGAFGSVIKASGIADLISGYASGSQLQGVYFLVLAWVIAANLKTAQGSSTSSMIITSSLLAPLASTAGLTSPMQLSVLVLAIGGGAFAVSHANDSYFWVVSQFGGISSKDSLSRFTPMTLLQGVTTLVTSIIILLLL